MRTNLDKLFCYLIVWKDLIRLKWALFNGTIDGGTYYINNTIYVKRNLIIRDCLFIATRDLECWLHVYVDMTIDDVTFINLQKNYINRGE